MTTAPEISGVCPPRFHAVKDAFAANFTHAPDGLNEQAARFSVVGPRARFYALFPSGWPALSVALEPFASAAGQAFSGRLGPDFWWRQAFLHLVKTPNAAPEAQPLLGSLLLAGAARLSEIPLALRAQIEPAGREIGRLLHVPRALEPSAETPPAAPPGPTESLLSYLLEGRLPEGSALGVEGLEPALLQWLSEEPSWARQWLLEHIGRAAVAERLSAQFSPSSLRAILKALFPSGWPAPSVKVGPVADATGPALVQHRRRGIGQHEGETVRGVAQVDWQVGTAGLKNAEHGHDQIRRPLQTQAHQ